MPLTVRFTARSHVGRVREGNEDSAYAGPRLLVVADGMGGHAAGEIASAAAVESLRELDRENLSEVAGELDEVDDLDIPAATSDGTVVPRYALRNAIIRANGQLRLLAERNSARRGMGTTVTAMLWDGIRFAVAHVGDSRAYLLRDGALRQITRDHTFVQTLVDEGRISTEEAEHHPQRSLILRALDGRGQVELDLFDLDVAPGDRVLLCSDGLSGVLSAAAIESALGAGDIEQAADQLIALALDGGAPDNVTCVIAEVLELGGPAGGALDDTVSIPLVDGVGRGIVVGAAAELDLEGLPGPPASSTETPDRRMQRVGGAGSDDDEETLRYAPREPGRFRWVRRIGFTALALAVLAGLGYAGWAWTRTQYYVGVDHDQVAIFRGLDQHLAGQSLSTVYEVSDVKVDDLPVFERDQIQTSISAAGLADARTITARLAARAEACVLLRAESDSAGSGFGASPGPTATPTRTTTSTPASSPPPTFTPGGVSNAPPSGSSEPSSTATSPTTGATTGSGAGDTTVSPAECGIAE